MPDLSQILSQQYSNLVAFSGRLLRGDFGLSPEYKFTPSFGGSGISTAGAFNTKPAFTTDPGLYDLDKVAAQSTFKDMWNSFMTGVNQTQLSMGQYGYYEAANKIAEIEGGAKNRGELEKLDEAYKNGEIKDVNEYQTKKNELLSNLSKAYGDLEKAKADISVQNKDLLNYPVKKSYQIAEQGIQNAGDSASFGDQVLYSAPSTMGSSFATMGATLTAGLVGKAARTAVAEMSGAWAGGPEVGAVATVAGLAASAAELMYARHLETEAEVGGQVDQDFQELKQRYLKETGKNENDLSKKELNDLIIQAHKGADDQYWKNMSLAGMDAVQAALLWGADRILPFSIVKALNASKLTRLGGQLGTLYLESQGEKLEEGLQFAFQERKSELALNDQFKDDKYYNKNFINRLGTDWADTLESIDFGTIKGNGRYSDNKQFQFSTESGFLLGLLMGGSGGVTRIAQDVYNYRVANKALKNLNLDTEGDIARYEGQVIKSFLEPRTKGSPRGAFIGAEPEDRAFYLKTALKSLAKNKDENGKPRISPESLQEMLEKIDFADETLAKVDDHLDNIFTGLGNNRKELGIKKALFRNYVYDNLMKLNTHEKDLSQAINEHLAAFGKLDPETASAVDLTNKLDILKELHENSDSPEVKKMLDKQIQQYTKELDSQIVAIGGTKIPSPSLDLNKANYKLVITKFFKQSVQNKMDEAMKIKSRNQLDKFLMPNEGGEITNDDTTDYSESLLDGDYKKLNTEQKDRRDKVVKKLAKKFGFDSKLINELEPDTLAGLVDEEFNDHLLQKKTYSDENSEKITSTMTSFDTFKNTLNNSKRYAQWVRENTGIKDLSKLTPNDFNKLTTLAKALVVKRNRDKKGEKMLKPIEGFTPGIVKSSGRTKLEEDERSLDDLKREFGVRAGKASQKDVLTAIANSKYSTPAEKQLATDFLKITKDDDVIHVEHMEKPGSYQNGKITVDFRFGADDYNNNRGAIEAILLHEIVHKYTADKIESSPELKEQLGMLYSDIMNEAKKTGLEKAFYGLKNEHELLAEIFANPELRERLKDIKLSTDYQNKYGKKPGAMQAFTDFIKNVLSALGVNTNNTVVEELLGLGTKIITHGETEEQLVGKAINIFKSQIRSAVAALPDGTRPEIKMKSAIHLASTLLTNPLITDLVKTKKQWESFNKLAEQFLVDLGPELLKDNNNLVFGQHSFKKGQYIVYNSPARNSFVPVLVDSIKETDDGDVLRVGVKNKEGGFNAANITDPDLIEPVKFATFEDANAYAQKKNEERNPPEPPGPREQEDYDNYTFKAGTPWKTVNQSILDEEDNEQPLYQHYKRVVDRLYADKTPLNQFRFFMVQDDVNPVLFPSGEKHQLPHDPSSLEYFKKGGKLAPVLVIIDQNGNPVRFDQDGKISDTGEIVVANLESVKKQDERLADTETIAAFAKQVGLIDGVTGQPDLHSAREIFKQRIDQLNNLRNQVSSYKVTGVLLSMDSISNGYLQRTKDGDNSFAESKLDNLDLDTAKSPVTKDGHIGYLSKNNQFKGLVGGVYVMNYGEPLLLRSKNVTEEHAREIMEIMDHAETLDVDAQNQVNNFLRNIIYFPAGINVYGRAITKGSGEARESFRGENRLEVLKSLRYRIVPELANTKIPALKLQKGVVIRYEMDYNTHIKNTSTTNVVLNNGVPNVISRYVSFTPGAAFNVEEKPEVKPEQNTGNKQTKTTTKSVDDEASDFLDSQVLEFNYELVEDPDQQMARMLKNQTIKKICS